MIFSDRYLIEYACLPSASSAAINPLVVRADIFVDLQLFVGV